MDANGEILTFDRVKQAGKIEYRSNSPEETTALAACPNGRIFAIYGVLGAGKTTLVQSFCEHMGSEDTVKSPTFAIVNAYDSDAGPIYHFDFYRIERLEEVYDLGYEEYFESGHYCFIEWPEMIGDLLPAEAVTIQLDTTGPLQRTITLTLQ